jgi:ribosomal protein S18 acetylase RimI-like enzyme
VTRSVGERIRAFEVDLLERCSDRVEETSFGRAYLHLGFPLRYSSNLIRVEGSLDGIGADALAADADGVFGEHEAFTHRRVEVSDEANAARLEREFLDLGWGIERDVLMAQRRDPEARPRIEVRDAGYADARPVIETVMRGQPFADSEEVVEQLVGYRAVLEREVGARFFIADVDGEPAAVCEGYVLGDVAQVEDVNTLEPFRGRGLASAVVLEASAWGRARGAELVFLVADVDDWPKELYRRLGFDEVLRSWVFTRVVT